MLLARVCGACGSSGSFRGPGRGPLCAACADQLVAAGPVPAPRQVDRLVAVLTFEGVGRDLVLGLKYRNRRGVVGPLAAAMAAAVGAGRPDVVTWAPTTRVRRQQRGFDQSELLARAVARQLDRPCRSLLQRRPGPPQTGRDGLARAIGPDLRARQRVPGHVLVVDDVTTTGATLSAAATALRERGAVVVDAVTAAATPLKVPPAAVDIVATARPGRIIETE